MPGTVAEGPRTCARAGGHPEPIASGPIGIALQIERPYDPLWMLLHHRADEPMDTGVSRFRPEGAIDRLRLEGDDRPAQREIAITTAQKGFDQSETVQHSTLLRFDQVFVAGNLRSRSDPDQVLDRM